MFIFWITPTCLGPLKGLIPPWMRPGYAKQREERDGEMQRPETRSEYSITTENGFQLLAIWQAVTDFFEYIECKYLWEIRHEIFRASNMILN